MGIRETFAANLARLCSKQKSISAICRALKVNRTQFDRYLRAEMLPLEPVLVKICNYFQVRPDELFRDPDKNSADVDPRAVKLYNHFIHPPPPLIESGTYFTYFEVPDRNDVAIRAITFVERNADLVSFRRVTGWAERSGTAWAHAQGNHYGVVIGRLNWIYFSAINRRQTGEPSLIAVQWAPLSEPVLTGLALLMTERGPAFVRSVLIKNQAPISPREAVRMAHVVPMERIDSVSRSLLRPTA